MEKQKQKSHEPAFEQWQHFTMGEVHSYVVFSAMGKEDMHMAPYVPARFLIAPLFVKDHADLFDTFSEN